MSLQTHAGASVTSQAIPAAARAVTPPLDWEQVMVGPSTPIWQRLLAAIGLVLLSPIVLIIGLLTKSTSPGTILYRGQRVGRGGKNFTIYKFRTLEVGAEQKIGARLLEHGDGLYTPIGRYLKRGKLDEIPQLFNVVRGDMNLVGPRPVRPVFLETFCREIPGYMQRFAVNAFTTFSMSPARSVYGAFFLPRA